MRNQMSLFSTGSVAGVLNAKKLFIMFLHFLSHFLICQVNISQKKIFLLVGSLLFTNLNSNSNQNDSQGLKAFVLIKVYNSHKIIIKFLIHLQEKF